MKKLLLLTILVAAVFTWQSCAKSCTCVNPDTDKSTEIEVSPNEKCSDYSDATRGNCS